MPKRRELPEESLAETGEEIIEASDGAADDNAMAPTAHDCCETHGKDISDAATTSPERTRNRVNPWMVSTIILAAYLVFTQLFSVDISPRWSGKDTPRRSASSVSQASPVPAAQPPPDSQAATADAALAAKVLPAEGFTLPVVWGDLGKKLISAGVIDEQKFSALYAQRGGLGPEETALLAGSANGKLKITPQNAQFLLNLLWAFGLGNKNAVLENGPMQDKQYGGADRFASTGGWTLAKGNVMDHYSKHEFVRLSAAQQALVERVSQNVYRPCCGNSTYFPDCNHGMAMLGLLELLASQKASEETMYRAALAVNSLWFPDTYVTIAKYLASQGTPWERANPQEVLGVNYSSGQGYRQIVNKVAPVKTQGGGGCGV